MIPADLTEHDVEEIARAREEEAARRERIARAFDDFRRSEAYVLFRDITLADERSALAAMVEENDMNKIRQHQNVVRCSRLFRDHYVPWMESMLRQSAAQDDETFGY